jgi:integrase
MADVTAIVWTLEPSGSRASAQGDDGGSDRFYTRIQGPPRRRIASMGDTGVPDGEAAWCGQKRRTTMILTTPKLGEYLDRILDDSLDLRPGSFAHYRQTAKHVEPLRQSRLAKLKTADLQTFFAGLLEGGGSPALCADVNRLLSKVFKKAQADDLIGRNPLDGVKLPKVLRREVRPLTPGQVRAIATNILPRYKAAVLVAAYGGLRVSEIGGLRAQDVDQEMKSSPVVGHRAANL